MKTYTADDVYAALGEIAPYDWKGFFKTRVYDVAPRAPLAGIEAGGWRLSYGDERTDFLKSQEAADGVIDLTASIGMTLRKGTGEDGSKPDLLGEILRPRARSAAAAPAGAARPGKPASKR